MKLSLKWLKELIDFNMTPEQLDSALTMLGIEVESIENPAKKYEGFYVAFISEKEKHPDADKLSVCKVNVGDNINLQVICGAPNVDKGQKVILGKSGAIVPSAGFRLEKRKIRGIESNGMICSESELLLGDSHDGIWILPDDAPIGASLSEYLGIDDVIFEISVTPNRADCLSHLGIAREIAALTGNQIRYPIINLANEDTTNHINQYLTVNIEDKIKCPRYTAKLIKNCKIGDSPDWLKSRLQSLGLRPINVAVDVTNLILMESGQPLHGFDYDKIDGNKINVKTANQGDKFRTLDGKERELQTDMLMICDDSKYIAIAGVMGGENSEITNNTTNILIESAYFQPSTVRKTSKKLALQSDSSYRFERGVDYDNISKACERAATLIAELSGGILVEGLIDNYPNHIDNKYVNLRYERARKIIGTDISNEIILDLMNKLNFKIINSDNLSLMLQVPSYRVDILEEIDLIEEIARLYNYDNIKSNFSSQINFGIQRIVKELTSPDFRGTLRHHYVHNGYTEILTQNQTDPKSIEVFGVESIRISNPLGEELSQLRTSLINSSLKVVSHNLRNGSSDLKLFEIGKVFNKSDDKDNFIDGIKETENLVLVLTGNNLPVQWGSKPTLFDFYDIKGEVELFIELSKVNGLKIKELKEHSILSPNSLAVIFKKKIIGVFGEVKKSILKHYDIEQKVFLAEISLSEIYKSDKNKISYQAISHYPSINRDLAFLVANDVSSGLVLNEINSSGGEYLENLILFDVYQGSNLGDSHKSLAFSLTFRANDRTLKESEIETALNNVISSVENKFNASLRKN